jgi:hypothetical protein
MGGCSLRGGRARRTWKRQTATVTCRQPARSEGIAAAIRSDSSRAQSLPRATQEAKHLPRRQRDRAERTDDTTSHGAANGASTRYDFLTISIPIY